MRYFQPEEFGKWFGYCDYNLLQALDDFRELWGAPVYISTAEGAVGRQAGIHIRSYHNIDHWGMVKAVDVFPSSMGTPASANVALGYATRCGITGFGLYPHWQYKGRRHAGLHLDVREIPARWGAVKDKTGQQIYVSYDEALAAFDTHSL